MVLGMNIQVSKAGTVKVEKLMEVERYSHVMHISSTVIQLPTVLNFPFVFLTNYMDLLPYSLADISLNCALLASVILPVLTRLQLKSWLLTMSFYTVAY